MQFSVFTRISFIFLSPTHANHPLSRRFSLSEKIISGKFSFSLSKAPDSQTFSSCWNSVRNSWLKTVGVRVWWIKAVWKIFIILCRKKKGILKIKVNFRKHWVFERKKKKSSWKWRRICVLRLAITHQLIPLNWSHSDNLDEIAP